MVDKSFCPCRKCGHAQASHGKNFIICYDCSDLPNVKAFCQYERLDNLPYLEWVYSQKESSDE
jgi:hypothetical protein